MKYKSELLVRRTDKVSLDKVEDSIILKRGDVVVVCPSPWNWSQAELNNPNWIVVKSDMTYEEATTYISPQKGDRRIDPALKLRAKSIDLDAIKLLLLPQEANKIDINHNMPIEISIADIRVSSKIKIKENPFKI